MPQEPYLDKATKSSVALSKVERRQLRGLSKPGARRAVIIGGGIGGLVAGAVLARSGMAVTLLEAQTYLGGCAGTFFRKGYRFDAGATVASGFGGAMSELGRSLDIDFEAEPAEEVMAVHIPGRLSTSLPSDRDSWRARRRELFGPGAERFWAWQERASATAWAFADDLPPWPATSLRDWASCVGSALRLVASRPSTALQPGLVLDARRPLAAHLPRADTAVTRDLQTFVDGLLLISAQTTSERALAIYGAAALDFPWRGVGHLRGGMGGLADKLAEALQRDGGRVLHRRRATRIIRKQGRAVAVETQSGERFEADEVLVNVTPWNLRELLDREDGPLPESLAELDDPSRDVDGAWGAVVLHCGIDSSVVDPAAPLHHQVHLGGPMGDGNTAFISVSPSWDEGRAPVGKRAVTITTHTKLAPWWELLERDRDAYAFHKASYQDRLLAAAEVAIPGFRRALHVVFAGTPVTYEFYTGRASGWVGGLPQTRLRNSFAPAFGPNLHMVGDSVFPGQSTLAVAMSSDRVARGILTRLGLPAPVSA